MTDKQTNRGNADTGALNWARIDELLQAGCTTREIAASMGCSPQTLQDRAMADKGCSWGEYQEAGSDLGKSCLREAQFRKASEGSDVMLKWLGEQLLGQKKDDLGESCGIAVTIKRFSVSPDGSQSSLEVDPEAE